MTEKRHSLIGFEPAFPVAEMSKKCESELSEFSEFTSNDTTMKFIVHDCCELLYLHHLELITLESPARIVDKCCQVASHYFFGPIRGCDRREKNWYRILSNAMLAAALGRRWDFVKQLAEWMRIDRPPEYAGPMPEQIQRLFFLIANHFRGEPFPGIAELDAELQACRTRAPRLLYQAWSGVSRKDEPAFQKALSDSVKVYSTRTKQDPGDAYIGERLARIESLIAAAALRDGLRLPEMKPELAARLITSETLGL